MVNKEKYHVHMISHLLMLDVHKVIVVIFNGCHDRICSYSCLGPEDKTVSTSVQKLGGKQGKRKHQGGVMTWE